MSALASSTSSANRLRACGSGTLTLNRRDISRSGATSTSEAISTVLGITDSRPAPFWNSVTAALVSLSNFPSTRTSTARLASMS